VPEQKSPTNFGLLNPHYRNPGKQQLIATMERQLTFRASARWKMEQKSRTR
jgi:hypothetical protein